MINYFLNSTRNNTDANMVLTSINRVKHFIADGDYLLASIPEESFESTINRIINKAKLIGDEKLANSCFVVYMYYLTFVNMGRFFALLDKKEYETSWCALQDCLDAIGMVEKHGGNAQYEIPNIRHILETFEKLYPYELFLSSSYIIGKGKCNICGESILGLNCEHINGELYWGKPACTIVEELFLREVSVVRNPDNKRCILRIKGKDYSYKKIDGFLSMGIPYMKMVKMVETPELNQDGTLANIRCAVTPIDYPIKWYYFQTLKMKNSREKYSENQGKQGD